MDRDLPQNALLVLTTCDSAASAAALAEHLVGTRLAACVNAIDRVASTYTWESRIEHATETLLLIKTTSARYAAVESAIRQRSSYELPEVVAVPVDRGLPGYLDWVRSATATEGVGAAVASDDDVREG